MRESCDEGEEAGLLCSSGHFKGILPFLMQAREWWIGSWVQGSMVRASGIESGQCGVFDCPEEPGTVSSFP